MRKIIIIIFITLILGTGAYLYYEYDKALNTEAPVYYLNVNEVEYSASSVKYQVEYWGGYIDKQEDIFLINPVETNNCINQVIVDNGSIISISENDDYSFDGSNLIFYDNGEYPVDITIVYEDNTECTYNMIFISAIEPEINISNLDPVQGELLTIEINDILINDSLEVECEFSPSFIDRNDTNALFYIPINYKFDAKVYPLKIKINDETYLYDINVNEYEFSEIHFTVSDEVSDSSKNNPDAGPEYRRLVWPLYDTYNEDLFWDGKLIKPVEENRISSGFGQYRYINNSLYPSRHSGIDYAADCGTEIVAAADGIVDISESLILSGGTIVIDHGLGLKSYYFHMQDLIVETGDFVEQGQLIAHVGSTGYSTGCHLHYQVSIKNQPVNPELLYK